MPMQEILKSTTQAVQITHLGVDLECFGHAQLNFREILLGRPVSAISNKPIHSLFIPQLIGSSMPEKRLSKEVKHSKNFEQCF